MRGNNDWLDYLDARRSDTLEHSAKGTTWKNHKYLKKIGNRYVYAKNKVANIPLSNTHEEVRDTNGKLIAEKNSTTTVGDVASKAKNAVKSVPSKIANAKIQTSHEEIQDISGKVIASRDNYTTPAKIAKSAKKSVSKGASKVKKIFKNLRSGKATSSSITIKSASTGTHHITPKNGEGASFSLPTRQWIKKK